MVLKTKTIGNCVVELVKNKYSYQVLVDGEIYYTGCNELFSVHRFNEI